MTGLIAFRYFFNQPLMPTLCQNRDPELIEARLNRPDCVQLTNDTLG
jgi:hypothetical protein